MSPASSGGSPRLEFETGSGTIRATGPIVVQGVASGSEPHLRSDPDGAPAASQHCDSNEQGFSSRSRNKYPIHLPDVVGPTVLSDVVGPTVSDASPQLGEDFNPVREVQRYNRINSALARLLMALVRAYQHLATGRPAVCRYVPSCSEYTLEAIATHGALKGCWYAICRLARCHPWGCHGFDPVPVASSGRAWTAVSRPSPQNTDRERP